MSGVGLRHGRGAVGDQVAGQEAQPVGAPQPAGFEAELGGERLVEHEQTRVGGGLGLPADGQLRQLAGEAVVQDRRRCTMLTLTQTTDRGAAGPGL